MKVHVRWLTSKLDQLNVTNFDIKLITTWEVSTQQSSTRCNCFLIELSDLIAETLITESWLVIFFDDQSDLLNSNLFRSIFITVVLNFFD